VLRKNHREVGKASGFILPRVKSGTNADLNGHRSGVFGKYRKGNGIKEILLVKPVARVADDLQVAERTLMPIYRTIQTSYAQPILSTNSLAIASLLLAMSAVVAGLSPILHLAFLPLSLLGFTVAVFGLFSCRDRSGLQVGALAVNGFVILMALLLGPIASPSTAGAAIDEDWGSIVSSPAGGLRLEGRVVDRDWYAFRDGHARIEFSVEWDTQNVTGCWNWIDGVVRFTDEEGDRTLDLDWRIPGTVTSSSAAIGNGGFDFDESQEVHRWLRSEATSRIRVSFIPTQWEHAALENTDGILVPTPAVAMNSRFIAGSK